MTDESGRNTQDENQATGPEGAPEAGEQTVDWSNPDTWPKEHGGRKGPEPTRYGDWERNGRCSDF